MDESEKPVTVDGTSGSENGSDQPNPNLGLLSSMIFRSLKRTHECFATENFGPPSTLRSCDQVLMNIKARDQLGYIKDIVDEEKRKKGIAADKDDGSEFEFGAMPPPQSAFEKSRQGRDGDAMALVPVKSGVADSSSHVTAALITSEGQQVAISHRGPMMPKPKWHPPWKLTRVIAGHYGWVRCLTVEPENQWFATGAADRLIKIWDLATAELKLTLTGHISAVRGLEVSNRMPYLFSCGEDKTVKCWDLEYNKVTRHYHGHLSAVYAISLHPTVDIFVTCGRDSVARVWDIRTKAGVHVLSGHTNTVSDVRCQAAEPQVITSSHDSTVRLWDLRMGRTQATLTHHKKSVRALTLHPKLYMFASASADNIKEWLCPDGKFVQNLSGHNAIINSLACNEEGVLVSTADNGTMNFWDWRTGYNFQKHKTLPQPGSIESEAGIFVCGFDHSGSRLLTGEADKTIKVYKEDESATEETHPISWKPDIIRGAAKF
ncbi:pleiotropic regulator 1-like isoform X2 [Paramacrobiotus metropolitanus]|nr:pleiotropic regulator 1-like isoform X2 [Paramacrobiotus metropolitanus]